MFSLLRQCRFFMMLHLSSFPPRDFHSRSLTVTQLLAARHAHRATTTFSHRHYTSHSPPSHDYHPRCRFCSRLQNVSFIFVFVCFVVFVFLCLVMKMFVNETLYWCEKSVTALGPKNRNEICHSLVGYTYGSSFTYTLLENRLWWHSFVSGSGSGSGFGKI